MTARDEASDAIGWRAPRQVLFCTDFSRNADFAFPYAVEAASRSPQSVLHILHVIPEPEAQFWKTYLYEVEDIDQKARDDIDRKMANAYLSRVPAGLECRVINRIGKDYVEILNVAESLTADLLVLGRQGTSALEKVLFGNVTEKVARKANCPVLIVPLTYEQNR